MKWKDWINLTATLLSLATISIMSLIVLQLFGILKPMENLSMSCSKEILRFFGY